METIRTCVGCRQRDSMKHLLKIVSVNKSFLLDEQRKLQGRGAWVHEKCLRLALDRKGLVRALGDSNSELLETWLRNQAENMADTQ